MVACPRRAVAKFAEQQQQQLAKQTFRCTTPADQQTDGWMDKGDKKRSGRRSGNPTETRNNGERIVSDVKTQKESRAGCLFGD